MFRHENMTRLNGGGRAIKHNFTHGQILPHKLDKPESNVVENDKKENYKAELNFDEQFSLWSLNDDSYSENGQNGKVSSLMSWDEDEFDKRSTEHVAQLFANIDSCLYDGAQLDNETLQQECSDWAERFPHIRVVGKGIFPQQIIEDRDQNFIEDQTRNDEEVFAFHSDAEANNKISAPSEQSLLFSERPISPSTSFKEQAVETLFDVIWEDLCPVLSEFVQNYTNVSISIGERRNSEPKLNSETFKPRKSSSNEKTVNQTSKNRGATKKANSNQNKTPLQKRVPSPHYMLPTVASSTTKKSNLISAHSKSRVISAAVHRRTPRRLMPINVDFPVQNSVVSKSDSINTKPTTGRLPPIDMSIQQLPNIPSKGPFSQQRSISSYSMRSLKSTLLPLSRAQTNDAFYDETDEELQNSLRSTLIISPLIERRKVVIIEAKNENSQAKTKKKISFG